MKRDEYRYWAERAAAWGEEYLTTLRERAVRARTEPGEIAGQLPETPPEQPHEMENIFRDFERIVLPGMTHWQHPRFFAYFPANAAPASMIAEQLTAVLAAQCMLWQTSPAATELETRMIDWLRQAVGLPAGFSGVIQDSATSATLSAVLTMREVALDWESLEQGLSGGAQLRVYASDQSHFSVDKVVRVVGIGQQNLVKIPQDATGSLDPMKLGKAIGDDRAIGRVPAGLVLTVGTTATGACDRLRESIGIAKSEGLYVHVDAAWAGSAMICPEMRSVWDGIEEADSIVINPHKWLGAQFDCSVQFLSDPALQKRALGLRPEYLNTPGRESEIVNYNEWTIPLGRRFRALKLWFLLRSYGLEGLRSRIRNHVLWATEAEERIGALENFKITTPRRLALFTFQWSPPGADPDRASERLLRAVNDDGRIYLTQAAHDGHFVIRFQVGQFDCTRDDVLLAVDVLKEISSAIGAPRE